MVNCVLTPSLSSNINRQKKRKLNIVNWKRNVAKHLRNSGQEYVTIHTENVIPAVELPRVGKVCAKKCHLPGCNASVPEKQEICRRYYDMAEYEKQRSYLLGLIQKEQNGTRKIYRYFIRIKDTRLEVCKNTFMDAHRIKRGTLVTVLDNLNKGNFEVLDGRGKHEHHKYVDQEIHDSIRRHIFQFTFTPIHYSRRSGDELCLPPEFNISRMFAKYKEEYPVLSHQKEWLYRERNMMSHPIYAPNQLRRRIQNRQVLNIMDAVIGILEICYSEPIPVSAEKKENLSAMLPFLPPQYRVFYENVIND